MPYLIIIIHLACMIYVLNEVWSKNSRFDETQKLIWTLAAVFAGIVTTLVYYALFKKEKPLP
jgi:hypothetical protein